MKIHLQPWQYKNSVGFGKCWYRFADKVYCTKYFLAIIPVNDKYTIYVYNIDHFPHHLIYSSLQEAKQAADNYIEKLNKLCAFI